MQSEISKLKSVVASQQSTILLMQNQNQQLNQQLNQMMAAPSNVVIDTRSTYTNSKDEKFPRVAAPRFNSLESKYINDLLANNSKHPRVDSNASANSDSSFSVTGIYTQFIQDDPQSNEDNYDGTESADAKMSENQE